MVVLPAVFPAIRKVCPDTGEELALTYSIPSANRPRVHRDSTVKNTPSQVVVGKLDSFKPPASHPCLQTTFIFFFFFFRYQKRANDSKWDEVRGKGWWKAGGQPVVRVRAILQPFPLTFLYALLSNLSPAPLYFSARFSDSPSCSRVFFSSSLLPQSALFPLHLLSIHGVTFRSGRSANWPSNSF